MELTAKYILEKVTDIFIFFVIIIFPIIFNSSGFFKILECKYLAYLVTFFIYSFIIIIVCLYFKLIKKEKVLEKLDCNTTYKFLLVFFLINVLSTIFSPYLKEYNIFIGIGRGEGLLTVIAYVFTFVFISIFGKLKKETLYYFSISGIMFCSIAILQFFGFNPFNMFQDGIGTHNVSFMGTIGNVDFISAYFCIVLPICVAHYVFSEKTNKNVIDLIAIFMIYIIFQVINVNSGRVALIATVIIFLPFILLNNKKLARFLTILSVIMIAYFFNLFINPEYHYSINRIKICLNFSSISFCFAILAIIFFTLSKKVNSLNYNYLCKKNILKIYALLMLFFVLMVAIIYFVNFSEKYGPIFELNQMLHGNFSDEYGTYRIFLWKRAVKLIKEYPLIGTGPDTFALRFMSKYTEDVTNIGELTINDTAANVYLTMLVNIGIVGTLFYIAFLITFFINMIKKSKKTSYIIFSGVVCYIIQDFFNLWVIIVTPIFWVVLALLYKSFLEVDYEK